MSAVSNSVQPISRAASTRLRALARSAPAKRHIPHPRGATSRPLLPSGMRASCEGPRLMQVNSNPIPRRYGASGAPAKRRELASLRGLPRSPLASYARRALDAAREAAQPIRTLRSRTRRLRVWEFLSNNLFAWIASYLRNRCGPRPALPGYANLTFTGYSLEVVYRDLRGDAVFRESWRATAGGATQISPPLEGGGPRRRPRA